MRATKEPTSLAFSERENECHRHAILSPKNMLVIEEIKGEIQVVLIKSISTSIRLQFLLRTK